MLPVDVGVGAIGARTPAVDSAYVAAQVAAAAQRAATGSEATTASIRLQLDPPELGPVQVTLRAAQDGIVAVLRAENPAAIAVLQGGQEDLRQRLEALGFKASAVEVTAAERPRVVVATGRSSSGRRSG
jgi:flagellar hook-length control protein FliK